MGLLGAKCGSRLGQKLQKRFYLEGVTYLRCALDKLDSRVCEAIVLVIHNLEWIIENDVFQIQGKFGVLIVSRECLPRYS